MSTTLSSSPEEAPRFLNMASSTGMVTAPDEEEYNDPLRLHTGITVVVVMVMIQVVEERSDQDIDTSTTDVPPDARRNTSSLH